MLKLKNDEIKNKKIIISGSGNVAQYAAEKAIQLGAKVLTMSDSSGTIYDQDGLDQEKLEYIKKIKNVDRGRIKEYTDKYQAKYLENQTPWSIKAEIALKCATQNEIKKEDAQILVKNGIKLIGEGANMPSTPEAIEIFKANNILFSPSKASNAGGVAVSGLEMSQNSIRLQWPREEVDKNLKKIMTDIHNKIIEYGRQTADNVDYIKGANIAGFKRVADSMLAQGIV